MPRKKANIHYIYKTTCNVTGRYYIGMHSTSNLEDGYLGSGKRLRYSIRKHGESNHVKEILEFCESRELLIEREKKIVNSDLLSDIMCMNLKEGGTGGLKGLNDETIKKIREASSKFNQKRWSDLEYRNHTINKLHEGVKKAHLLGKYKSNKSFLNKTHSDETKKLMSLKANERVGDKNSQYGTMWITNGKENKKVNKNFKIEIGWYKGRTLKIKS